MLKKVIIRNFKSLRDVELDMQKVNLLIGTNNSGKSNFLKALQYFSTEKNKNKFGEIPFKSKKRDYNIPVMFFNIERDDNGYFHYIKEENDINFGYADKILKDINLLKFPSPNQRQRLLYTRLRNNDDAKEKCRSFIKTFNNLKIYKPDPNKLRSFQVLGSEEYVNEDASNLVSFLDNMRDSKPEIIEAIVKDLKMCISTFEDIRFKKDSSNTSKKQIGLIDVNKNVYWSDDLSEGVLYFLSILSILHQPSPPKILLLEEPERNVHPRRIKEIINFIIQLSEDKDVQIVMTTHSMVVVDEFKDIPESVFIFDMFEGETKIKNLKTDIIDVSDKKSNEKNFPVIDFTETLGEKWLTGFFGGVPLS